MTKVLPPAAHKILTIEDVIDLGRALIKVSNAYPTRYLTERDFFPLVVAYLTGRVPSLQAEATTESGRIDFHLKGTNPTWLELAVQPRSLVDMHNAAVRFPGHTAKGCLYASQNRSELKKLIQQRTGRTRFILLVDLRGGYDLGALKEGYKREAAKVKGGSSVRIIYVSQTVDPESFLAKPKAKKKAPKTKAS